MVVYNGFLGRFPEAPPDREFKYIIESGSHRIVEWIDELQESDHRLGYYHSKDGE
jgi:hypothetical protein